MDRDTQGPLTSADVQTALETLGLKNQVITFNMSNATAPQAAEAIGTELGRIVKSLCFIIADETAMVLAAGDQRIDERKLSALYGVGRKKVKIADRSPRPDHPRAHRRCGEGLTLTMVSLAEKRTLPQWIPLDSVS